jgi:hypothetical protein
VVTRNKYRVKKINKNSTQNKISENVTKSAFPLLTSKTEQVFFVQNTLSFILFDSLFVVNGPALLLFILKILMVMITTHCGYLSVI